MSGLLHTREARSLSAIGILSAIGMDPRSRAARAGPISPKRPDPADDVPLLAGRVRQSGRARADRYPTRPQDCLEPLPQR